MKKNEQKLTEEEKIRIQKIIFTIDEPIPDEEKQVLESFLSYGGGRIISGKQIYQAKDFFHERLEQAIVPLSYGRYYAFPRVHKLVQKLKISIKLLFIKCYV